MISTKRSSKPSERNRREESEDRLPEIRTAREDKTVEVISGVENHIFLSVGRIYNLQDSLSELVSLSKI